MKVVQLLNNSVHYVYDNMTLTQAEKKFNLEQLKTDFGITTIETNADNAREHWRYDAETDSFLEPVCPENWAYDTETGRFYNTILEQVYDNEDAEKTSMAEFIISLEE